MLLRVSIQARIDIHVTFICWLFVLSLHKTGGTRALSSFVMLQLIDCRCCTLSCSSYLVACVNISLMNIIDNNMDR